MSDAVLHIREYEGGAKLVQFYCPGCRHLHYVNVAGDKAKHPVWEWNGDRVKPTLAPSIKVTGYIGEAPEGCCHSFVRNGRIEFLPDCTHDHAGRPVDLLPVAQWPEPIRSYTLD